MTSSEIEDNRLTFIQAIFTNCKKDGKMYNKRRSILFLFWTAQKHAWSGVTNFYYRSFTTKLFFTSKKFIRFYSNQFVSRMEREEREDRIKERRRKRQGARKYKDKCVEEGDEGGGRGRKAGGFQRRYCKHCRNSSYVRRECQVWESWRVKWFRNKGLHREEIFPRKKSSWQLVKGRYHER